MCADTNGDYYVECTYCHSRSYAWGERCNAEMIWNSRKIPEDLIAERWEEAQSLLLQAVSNAGFLVTHDKKYDAPLSKRYRQLNE